MGWSVLAPLTLVVAADADGPWLEMSDPIFIVIFAVAMVFIVRRQLTRKLPTAPLAPEDAGIESEWNTKVLSGVGMVLASPLLLLFAADFRGVAVLLCCAMAGLSLWFAKWIADWERRTRSRLYRERRFWARGAPFYYRLPPGG